MAVECTLYLARPHKCTAGSPEVVVQLLGHSHHGAVVQVPGAPAGGRYVARSEAAGVSDS